jgi:hypothetical protein
MQHQDFIFILLFVGITGTILLVEAEKYLAAWLYRRRKKQHEAKSLAERVTALEADRSNICKDLAAFGTELYIQRSELNQLHEQAEWSQNRLSLHQKALSKRSKK